MSIPAAELMNQPKISSKNDVAVEKSEKRGIINFSAFPWLRAILRMCREALGSPHIHRLESLLHTFVEDLSVSIKDCYTRPNRAAKLKKIVNEIMVYIDMIYQNLKADYMGKNSVYLLLMTNLVAIYLDLEIKCSKRSGHSLKKIGQFMSTALYTYLDRSEDHIIEAVLNAKLITKSAGELCAPVLFKLLSDSRCFIRDEKAYVRFLLAFKLLYKITRKKDRPTVTRMALKKLNPAPKLLENVRKMSNIFPTLLLTQECITPFLMNTNFDYINAKHEFLRTSNISNCNNISSISAEKRSTYDNRLDSILYDNRQTNLLKGTIKQGHRANSIFNDAPLSDVELDPSTYRISLFSLKEQHMNIAVKSDDDSDDITFVGTASKADKPVIVITLDSDNESETENGNESHLNKEFTNTMLSIVPRETSLPETVKKKRKIQKLKKKFKNFIGKERVKEDSSVLKELVQVEECEKCLKTETIEECAARIEQEGPTVKLKIPEQRVADSTSSCIDSSTEESLHGQEHQVYEIHSNNTCDDPKTDFGPDSDQNLENRFDTLQGADSTIRKLNADSLRANVSELNSRSASVTNIMQLESNRSNNIVENTELQVTQSENDTIACSVSRQFQNSHKSYGSNVNENVPVVHPHSFHSQLRLDENEEVTRCPQLKFDNNQLEQLCLIHNYSITKNKIDHSMQVVSSMQDDADQQCSTFNETKDPSEFIQSHSTLVTSENNEVNVVQEPFNPVNELALNQNSYPSELRKLPLDSSVIVQDRSSIIINTPNTGNTVKEFADSGARDVNKKIVISSNNLDKLINSTKKVSYENVAKSYKIVKSSFLKPNSMQEANLSLKSNDISETNTCRLKMSQNYVESNVLDNCEELTESESSVNECLDFRTPNISQVTSSGSVMNRTICPAAKAKELVLPTSLKHPATPARVQKNNIGMGEEKYTTNICGRVVKANSYAPIIFKKLSTESIVGNDNCSTKTQKEEQKKASLVHSSNSISKSAVESSQNNLEQNRACNQVIRVKGYEMFNTGGVFQSYDKKQKSVRKTAIKTDINMKSTLRHINPSSIPQFSKDLANDKKRKYPLDVKQKDTSSVPHICSTYSNSPVVKAEGGTVKVKFAVPEQSLSNDELEQYMNKNEKIVNVPMKDKLLPVEPYYERGSTFNPLNNKNYFPAATVITVPEIDILTNRNNGGSNVSDIINSTCSNNYNNINNNNGNKAIKCSGDNFSRFSHTFSNDVIPPSPCIRKLNHLNFTSIDNTFGREVVQPAIHPLSVHQVKPPVEKSSNISSPETVRSELDLINNSKLIGNPVIYEQNVLLNVNVQHFASGRNCVSLPSSVLNSDYIDYGQNRNQIVNDCEVTNIREKQEKVSFGDNLSDSVSIPTFQSGSGTHGVKASLNVPRDLIIGETAEDELRIMEEEYKYFEQWPSPRDTSPDDFDLLLKGLPDSQNFFNMEDILYHMQEMSFTSIDSACSASRELDGHMFECLSNDSLVPEKDCQIFESPKLADSDSTGDFKGNNHCDAHKNSSRVMPSETCQSFNDCQKLPPTKKGQSSFPKKRTPKKKCLKKSSTARDKNKSIYNMDAPASYKVDKEKLRSDSVAYHTRSVTQKGIPIEYTSAPLKGTCGKGKTS